MHLQLPVLDNRHKHGFLCSGKSISRWNWYYICKNADDVSYNCVWLATWRIFVDPVTIEEVAGDRAWSTFALVENFPCWTFTQKKMVYAVHVYTPVVCYGARKWEACGYRCFSWLYGIDNFLSCCLMKRHANTEIQHQNPSRRGRHICHSLNRL